MHALRPLARRATHQVPGSAVTAPKPYIGHRNALAILCRRLPPVTLLTGPASVGKWTLVHHLVDHHRIALVDLLLYPRGLTAPSARHVVEFAHRAPMGLVKVVGVRLEGSTDQAMTILLKTLEEPPATTRFLLTSSQPVPPTLASRCEIHRFGLLNTNELTEVLLGEGFPTGAASRGAVLGRGQVKPAQAAADPRAEDSPKRAVVLAVVRALAGRDRALFERAFKHFDEDARQLLLIWLREALTRRWAVYTREETFGLADEPERLIALLTAVSQLSRASARIGVRAALEPFLTPF